MSNPTPAANEVTLDEPTAEHCANWCDMVLKDGAHADDVDTPAWLEAIARHLRASAEAPARVDALTEEDKAALSMGIQALESLGCSLDNQNGGYMTDASHRTYHAPARTLRDLRARLQGTTGVERG